MKNYIFGYGSLINKRSIAKTSDKFKKPVPVTVKGLKRGWYFCDKNEKRSAVGAVFDGESFCNGVVFEAQKEDLIKFDQREEGYTRVKLNLSDIEVFYKEAPKDIIVWTYIVNSVVLPEKDYPIVQSYVDTVLEGCLCFGKNFADDFIFQTKEWERPWVNDRRDPRFKRYDHLCSFQKIDEILKNTIPHCLNQRKNI